MSAENARAPGTGTSVVEVSRRARDSKKRLSQLLLSQTARVTQESPSSRPSSDGSPSEHAELESQLDQLRSEAKLLREKLQQQQFQQSGSLEVLQQQLQHSQQQLAALRAENVTLLQELVQRQALPWGAVQLPALEAPQPQEVEELAGAMDAAQSTESPEHMSCDLPEDLESDHDSNPSPNGSQPRSRAPSEAEVGPMDNASENGEVAASQPGLPLPFNTKATLHGWSFQ